MTTRESGTAAEGRRPAGEDHRMEQLIEAVASGLGNSIAWLAEHGVLFAIFAVIWVAIGVGIVWSQGSVDAAWASIRDLPLIVQLVAWLLFLPVMAGLWVWETTWPLVVRLIVLVGIAGWNLLVLLPRAAQAPAP
jgi:ABC-type amino acid transport system permease subunit